MEATQTTKPHHKTHHDARPYEVANKESAEKTKKKLLALFEQGRARLHTAMTSVESEVPLDALVPFDKFGFGLTHEKKLNITYDVPKNATKPTGLQQKKVFGIHEHAYGQLLEKAGIPKKYGDLLLTENPELLVDNLTKRYKEDRSGKKFLARAVNGQLRGWLSDSYGRYDVMPMVTAFLDTCRFFNAVPTDAANLDTRFYLKMMLPHMFEPIENEILAFGIQFRSSDYGDGAYDVRGFVQRTWCTNDAMSEECLRQVHLSAKLTAENFSPETMMKQAEMLASATRDTVRGILKPENIERRLAIIKEADERQVPIKDTLANMRKNSNITKDEEQRIQEILTTSDIQVLPPVRGVPEKGATSAWRLSNAFSFLAHEEGVDARRGMDLELLAGQVAGLQVKQAKKKGEEEEVAVEA